jgi:outer membrane protein
MNETEDFYQEVNNPEQIAKEQEINYMKKFRLQMILNIILFTGLLICLILLLTQKNVPKKVQPSGDGMNIAFVNSDTLMSHYELFQDLKLDLEAETLKLSKDIEQRKKALENQFLSYQNKVQSGTISYDDAKKAEENLGRQQQELMLLGEQYSNQISEQEYEMSVRVFDSLNVVLLMINEQSEYDYILGYTPGAGILYANPSHDITEAVLEILNERYLQGLKSSGKDKK